MIKTYSCLLAVLLAGCASGKINMPFQDKNQDAKSKQGVTSGQDKTSKKKKSDPLMDPSKAKDKAPDEFKVNVETTEGDFVLQVTREWSPNGADRFYNLVNIGYYSDIAIFRAVNGFMFQFGIHGNPKVSAVWRKASIKDDKGKDGVSNKAGYITFASGGQDTRTTQLFVNLGDNGRLDSMGFTPFGKVIKGMDVVKKINTEYGDTRKYSSRFQSGGNKYIKKKFPNLDYIKSMKIIEVDGMQK